MKDLHDIVLFPYNGEKILGIVLKHYTNPLSDFYITYAEHCLYEYHSSEECVIISEDVIMPACDAALADYKVKKQHIQDIVSYTDKINSLVDAMKNMDIDSLFT